MDLFADFLELLFVPVTGVSFHDKVPNDGHLAEMGHSVFMVFVVPLRGVNVE